MSFLVQVETSNALYSASISRILGHGGAYGAVVRYLRLARRFEVARELRCALIETGEVRLEQMELVDGKGWLWNGFANGSPSISVPSRASLLPKPD
jgi:hypothetical protein